ncbi:Uncharacterised protein [Mycobacteroides abscessus subsp. abscessus]|nr:Uncharacterised protein [Mycobacteroides abscessus subsp. abscessus]
MIDLLVVGGDHRLVARGIEKCHHPSQRVIAGALSVQPGHGPHLRHGGRRDDSGMTSCFRGLLVDIDRVAVAHRLDPVVDHRLVHRIPCQAGRARAVGLDLGETLLDVHHAHRGTLGVPNPAVDTISRITSFTPPPKVITRWRLVCASSHSRVSAVFASAGSP